MMKHLIAALVIAAWASHAAAEREGPIIGVGKEPCSKWTAARTNRQASLQATIVTWIQGSLVGQDLKTEQRLRLDDLPGEQEIRRFLDQECARDPSTPLFATALALHVRLQKEKFR